MDAIWPSISEKVIESCSYSRNITPSWLYRLCRSGEGFLFAICDEEARTIEATFIGRFIEDYAGGPAFEIIALQGKGIERWMPELRAWQWPRLFNIKTVTFASKRPFDKKVEGVRAMSTRYEVDLLDA